MQVVLDQEEQCILSDHGSDPEDLFEPDDDFSNQNHTPFDEVIEEAKRRNISLNAIYAVLNKVMVVLKKTHRSDYLSYGKVRNTWLRIGGQLEDDHNQLGEFEFLGFDGKKSDVLCEQNR